MTKKLIIAFHSLFLIMLFSSNKYWLPTMQKKISIHFQTSQKKTKNKNTIAQSFPKQPNISSVKKQSQSKVSKAHSNTPVPPKPVAKKTAPTSKSERKVSTPVKNPQKEKETIAKIEEKIDKLEQITKVEQKQYNSQSAGQDMVSDEYVSSPSEVASYLFQMLELPGPGKVVVNLHLDKLGKIELIEILESENVENSLYLLQSLKDLVLPFKKVILFLII